MKNNLKQVKNNNKKKGIKKIEAKVNNKNIRGTSSTATWQRDAITFTGEKPLHTVKIH